MEITNVNRIKKDVNSNQIKSIKNIRNEMSRNLKKYENMVNENLSNLNIYKQLYDIEEIIKNSEKVSEKTTDIIMLYSSIDSWDIDVFTDIESRYLLSENEWEEHFEKVVGYIQEYMGKDFIITDYTIQFDESKPHLQLMGIYREEIKNDNKIDERKLTNALKMGFSRYNKNVLKLEINSEEYEKEKIKYFEEHREEKIKSQLEKNKKISDKKFFYNPGNNRMNELYSYEKMNRYIFDKIVKDEASALNKIKERVKKIYKKEPILIVKEKTVRAKQFTKSLKKLEEKKNNIEGVDYKNKEELLAIRNKIDSQLRNQQVMNLEEYKRKKEKYKRIIETIEKEKIESEKELWEAINTNKKNTNELEKKNEELNQKIVKKYNEIEKEDKLIKELEESNKAKEKEKEEDIKLANEIKEVKETKKGRLKELKKDIIVLENEIGELKNKKEGLESTLKKYEEDKKRVNEEHTVFTFYNVEQVDKKKETYKPLFSNKEYVDKESYEKMKDITTKYLENNDKVVNANKKKREIENKNKELENKNKGLENTIKDKQTEIDDLETAVENYKNQINNQKTEIDRLKNNNENLKKNNADYINSYKKMAKIIGNYLKPFIASCFNFIYNGNDKSRNKELSEMVVDYLEHCEAVDETVDYNNFNDVVVEAIKLDNDTRKNANKKTYTY